MQFNDMIFWIDINVHWHFRNISSFWVTWVSFKTEIMVSRRPRSWAVPSKETFAMSSIFGVKLYETKKAETAMHSVPWRQNKKVDVNTM